MENFPLLGFVVPLQEATVLQHIKDRLGHFHLGLTAGGLLILDNVSIDQTLEEERSLVGHAALVLAAEDIIGQRFIDEQLLCRDMVV